MKTQELSKLLNDLIACGNKLVEVAEGLNDLCSNTADNKEEKPTEPESKTYTDVEVRSALGEKAKANDRKYKPEVKALVEKYSSDGTFTGISSDKYTELMKELEGIGNE